MSSLTLFQQPIKLFSTNRSNFTIVLYVIYKIFYIKIIYTIDYISKFEDEDVSESVKNELMSYTKTGELMKKFPSTELKVFDELIQNYSKSTLVQNKITKIDESFTVDKFFIALAAPSLPEKHN